VALILLLLASLSALAQEPAHRCAACHSEAVADFKTHRHAASGLDCGICHGPSEKHRTSVGNVPPDQVAAPSEVAALCGNCHLAEKQQYEASAHGRVYTSGKKVRTANCNTCHGHHAMRPWAAQVASCQRCHSELPASCKQTPVAPNARVSCMGCHARHTLQVSGR
jgi:hypothetical protein